MNQGIELSIIVPVSERYDEVAPLYHAYKSAVAAAEKRYEFIYVLDGEHPGVLKELQELREEGEPIRIITLAKWFGEATALTAGFEKSAAGVILTLPAYSQIEASEIPRLVAALEHHDMVIGRRWPRIDSKFNQAQARIFHWLLNFVTHTPFQDIGCAARIFKRRVIDEVSLYGDQHRFLPLLAQRQGFRVLELNVAQSRADAAQRVYRPGVYVRRILDLLTTFFLVKFTKKPLRFFGLLGCGAIFLGALFTLYVIVERLFFEVPLGDRPALLLSSLLVVLGIQIFAIGLIGEIIIFTHAKDLKEYTIERIVE
jgi:glycosyltransferase involved in cell wall biosynthesis